MVCGFESRPAHHNDFESPLIMAVNVETLDKLERRIRLTLPADAVAREVESRLRKLSRTVKADGFRPGKVPMSVVTQRYGYSVHNEVMNDQVGRAFSDAANEAEGDRAKLSWNQEHFPSLLLWMSNRGRKAAPWSSRHVALGMEPICSPFGLGPASARADNPIAKSGTPTARDFKAGEVFTTRYRIEAEAI